MFTVVMPKLGDTMEEGKILRWIKQEGDTVQKGDAVAEIETEKVNIEVEAFAAGTLRKVIAPEGETLAVGAPIALIGAPDEALPPEFAGGSQQPQAATKQAKGTAQAAENAKAPVAQAVAVVAPVQTAGNGHSNGHVETQTASNGGRVFISPIARRIAAEHNVDVAHIQGTGPNGRIIKEDVEAALVQPQQAPAEVPQAAPAAQVPSVQPVPATVVGEEVEAVPLTAMRKTIARRLQQSMQTAPHFYVTVSIDTTRLGEVRNQINEYAATLPQPVKVSYNDLIVKAVATALTRMPQVNVSFDNDRLLYKKHINVGVAVALDTGLIVPVVRDADKRGLLDVARESRRLTDAARAGKLKPEEFSGGTFTVSNLGMFDVESFTAVINPPESAILAIGAIVPTPVVLDGQVVVRDQMKVTLSVDHRALDGATAARFLQELKHLLEQPMGMLV
jgi:pyruvate dehydrogenase E2 component (dihydrolipoamide acetyltransferase)